jgi:hypothetical protein
VTDLTLNGGSAKASYRTHHLDIRSRNEKVGHVLNSISFAKNWYSQVNEITQPD